MVSVTDPYGRIHGFLDRPIEIINLIHWKNIRDYTKSKGDNRKIYSKNYHEECIDADYDTKAGENLCHKSRQETKSTNINV
jgi:hypothetical protein